MHVPHALFRRSKAKYHSSDFNVSSQSNFSTQSKNATWSSLSTPARLGFKFVVQGLHEADKA
jgi:hypothetical protein